jgi:hypothetical protein
MNEHEPPDPLLRQLDQLADLQPSRQAADRALERARAALNDASLPLPVQKRRTLMTLRNVAAIAASLLFLAVAVHWLRPFEPAQSLAFEDVQKAVEQTKSVQYVQTGVARDKDGRKGPEMTEKVMVLGRYRIRRESKMTAPGDPLPEGVSSTESSEPTIMIQNAETGAFLDLLPERKTYFVPELFVSLDPDTGKFSEEKPRAVPEADFYRQIRDVPKNATRIADRQVGDVTAQGFQTVEKKDRNQGTDTWTRTYWVDPSTKLPIRIEVEMRSTHPFMADTDAVIKDIVFDAPLDESLFSTEPPPGYTNSAKAAGK